MLRFLALAFLLLSSPALAQWGGQANIVNVANPQVLPPAGSPGLPAVDDNLAAGNYGLSQGVCAEWGHQVPCTQHYSITRASIKYCAASDGTWFQVASGIGCLTNQGQLIEEARTNTALWARDMTQAAWTVVGISTALNAVGIDGTANSATTLTATGTVGSCVASCTILQSLTIGSTAENYSVWLKRVTGAGTVNITINNLVATTACTLSTTVFTRCTVTTTLANPVIGIQLTALNDVVIADFNQLEAATFPTSPIPTTTTSATRAADNVTAGGQLSTLLAAASGTVIVAFNTPIVSAASARLFTTVADTSTMYLVPGLQLNFGGSGVATTANTYTLGANAKGGGSWNTATWAASLNAGTVATDATPPVVSGVATIGNRAAVDRPLNGSILRLTPPGLRISDTTMQGMTR